MTLHLLLPVNFFFFFFFYLNARTENFKNSTG